MALSAPTTRAWVLIRIWLRPAYRLLLELKCACTLIYQFRPPFFRRPSMCLDTYQGCHVFTGQHYLYSDCGGAIVDQANQILAQYSGFPWGVRLHPLRTSLSFRKNQIRIERCVYSITPEADGNFYHWMIDCLPRIQLAFEYDSDFFYKATLLLHSAPASYERESLVLGLPEMQSVKWLKANESVVCRELLVSPALCSLSLLQKTASLRQFFFAALQNSWSIADGSSKIYVTRAKAQKRKLVGEAALISFLLPLGFKVVSLEDLSLLQQVSLFRTASCVVAPHGAGLALTAFMSEGCHVLEIMSRYCQKDFYLDIARVCGLSYQRICAEPLARSPFDTFLSTDQMHGNAQDLVVSRQVIASLKQALSVIS